MPGARGEGVIQAGDREVRVLFTNRAMLDAEEAMGKSFTGVLMAAKTSSELYFADVLHLLRAGMEAARRDAREGGHVIGLKDAQEVLDAVGITTVASVVIEAAAEVLSYGADAQAEDPNP